MAQFKKDEVREEILNAALELFFDKGYSRTTMVEIVRKANTSMGNLYRYFDNKLAIYYALIPDVFVEDFKDILVKRTAIMHKKQFDISLSTEENQWYDGFYFDFLIKNKKRLIILLCGGKGTKHESIREYLLRAMVDAKYVLLESGRENLFAGDYFSLMSLIVNNIMDLYSSVLSNGMPEDEMRALLSNIDYYHLKGMSALWNKRIG
jgi:AcrR family transcriptional regulator